MNASKTKKARLEPNLVGLYYSLLSFNDVCSLQTAVAILNIDYIARTSGHTLEVIHKYYHALLDEVSNKEADKVKSIWG